jgi:hypothetical protein
VTCHGQDLHLRAVGMIGLVYTAIPGALTYVTRRKHDDPGLSAATVTELFCGVQVQVRKTSDPIDRDRRF